MRYFAWKDNGFWQFQKLATAPQIRALLSQLDSKYEAFASIQDHDAEGNILGCPLYADLDGTNLNQVHADAITLVQTLQRTFGLDPAISFSGSKGFHIVMPQAYITHPRCHEIAGMILRELTNIKTLDPKVYRTRAMLRIAGTPNAKTNCYKTQLHAEELFALSMQDIRELSRQRHKVTAQATTRFTDQAWTEMVQSFERNLQTYSQFEPRLEPTDITPCIAAMLTTPAETGERNATIFTLAKAHKIAGHTQEETLLAILKQPHFSSLESERDVSKVVRSVFQSRQETRLGCKTGSSAALMRNHCHPFCQFNDDFHDITFGN